MASWRHLTGLFIIMLLSMTDNAAAGCKDYFEVGNWAKDLLEDFSLVQTKNPEDVMRCTLERECLQHHRLCEVFVHCFRDAEPQSISERCEGDTSQTVPFYHFMCLTANALNHVFDGVVPKGCEYVTSCEPNRGETSTADSQTTQLSTTAATSLSTAATSLSTAATSLSTAATSLSTAATSLSTAATSLSTAATSLSTAATSLSTAATTLSTAATTTATTTPTFSLAETITATAATTLATVATAKAAAATLKGTALIPALTVVHTQVSSSSDYSVAEKEILVLKTLLVVSAILNVVMLGYYLYRRRQRRSNREQVRPIPSQDAEELSNLLETVVFDAQPPECNGVMN